MCARKPAGRLAPRVGFEPTTIRLTVERSTTELPRNISSSTRSEDRVPALADCFSSGERLSTTLDDFGACCPAGPHSTRALGAVPNARRRPRNCIAAWRPRPELNRGTRICSPLRHHSATWPQRDTHFALWRARPAAPDETEAGASRPSNIVMEVVTRWCATVESCFGPIRQFWAHNSFGPKSLGPEVPGARNPRGPENPQDWSAAAFQSRGNPRSRMRSPVSAEARGWPSRLWAF